MRQFPFVWLGSGRAHKRHVGNKGVWLDAATRARLPVPNGGILQDEFYQLALEEGVAELQDGQIDIPDPEWMHSVLFRDVRFPRLDKPVIIRHIFAQPEHDLHGDGRFPAASNINIKDPTQLSAALARLWNAATVLDAGCRRDLLVMVYIQPLMAGTAVISEAIETDTIQLADSHTQISLPRLARFQRPDRDLPPFAQRLQRLLDGVRRTFGKGDWAIKWIDDGNICWLVRIM